VAARDARRGIRRRRFRWCVRRTQVVRSSGRWGRSDADRCGRGPRRPRGTKGARAHQPLRHPP